MRRLALALLAALLLGGCVDSIDAPPCSTVDDCDRDAGYLFCREGYCFARPAPDDLPDTDGDTSADPAP